MNLLLNDTNGDHLTKIKELFVNNSEVFIAVAFLKESGLNKVLNELSESLKAGSRVTIICGLDFGLTEPDALLLLHNLTEKFPLLNVRTYLNSNKTTVFHPKIYFGTNKDTSSLIVGSANFTTGGFLGNRECSLFLPMEKSSDLYKDMQFLFDNFIEESDECTLLSILQYQTFFHEQKKIRKKITQKPPSDITFFDYKTLQQWLVDYKAENDINLIYNRKRKHYAEAKKVLDTIADTRSLTTKQFAPLLEKLVGGKNIRALWHSGSIYRMKTKVFEHPRAFQALVHFIRTNKQRNPSFVFEGAKRLVNSIEGSGVNTITEIMMTYNNTAFANLNKNPITVLRREGGVDLKAHRNSFNERDYEMYCNLVTEISKHLGLRDMLEADSFFNDIYWQSDVN